jgi:hypothetical protein
MRSAQTQPTGPLLSAFGGSHTRTADSPRTTPCAYACHWPDRHLVQRRLTGGTARAGESGTSCAVTTARRRVWSDGWLILCSVQRPGILYMELTYDAEIGTHTHECARVRLRNHMAARLSSRPESRPNTHQLEP